MLESLSRVLLHPVYGAYASAVFLTCCAALIVVPAFLYEYRFGPRAMARRKAARQKLRDALGVDNPIRAFKVEGTRQNFTPLDLSKPKSPWKLSLQDWWQSARAAPTAKSVDREAFEREVRRWD